MRIERFTDHGMTPRTRSSIAAYRHKVFVQSLRWDLRCEDGHEQDEFDVHGAVHIVAYDHGTLIGYARLLPTTQPYLLATHFSHLLSGAASPSTPLVWELSRFASSEAFGMGGASGSDMRTQAGKRLLLEAVRFVVARGARQIVCCTSVAIERLAQRWGVDIQRLGPPIRSSGGLLVATCIDCTERTFAALVEEWGADYRQTSPGPQADPADLPGFFGPTIPLKMAR